MSIFGKPKFWYDLFLKVFDTAGIYHHVNTEVMCVYAMDGEPKFIRVIRDTQYDELHSDINDHLSAVLVPITIALTFSVPGLCTFYTHYEYLGYNSADRLWEVDTSKFKMAKCNICSSFTEKDVEDHMTMALLTMSGDV